jgi:hypothetical protein
MKTLSSAPRIAVLFAVVCLASSLAPPAASAGLFHRRTVIVESPTVYVAPVPTVYSVPVSTVVAAPAPTVYTSPVIDSALVPTNYVPTLSTSVVGAPVTTTYLPTVTTVPTVLAPATRVRVVYPRRTYLYGY